MNYDEAIKSGVLKDMYPKEEHQAVLDKPTGFWDDDDGTLCGKDSGCPYCSDCSEEE